MLVDKYHHWMRRLAVDQVPTIAYPCPCCKEELLALQPPEGEEDWDSLVTCPYCEGIHYRVAQDTGHVKVWSMSE